MFFNIDMDFIFFWKNIKKIVFVYLIQLGVFTFFRVSLLLVFGNFDELRNYKMDLLKAFYVGAKFDTSVILYSLLPIVLVLIIFSFFSNRNQKKINGFILVYTFFTSFVFIAFEITDFFFYDYFQTHISPVIFGIKDDNTGAILASMWTDYPVVKVLIALSIGLVILYKLLKKIIFHPYKTPVFKHHFIVFILFLGLYFIGLRGTLSMFPLRLHHTTISTHTFINDLVLNGVFAFKIANSFNSHTKNISPKKINPLKKYHFKSVNEAISILKNKPIEEVTDFKKEMFVNTAKDTFLENNKPNVVFILIESFSRHYIDIDSANFNLLGSLRKELPNLIVFKNFLSGRNGTIESLEGLLINTPITPVSQSKYNGIPFNTSVALPFKNADYSTTYLTGDKLGWRNTGNFIKKQYFDNVIGESYLENKYNDIQKYEWGIFDEYLYREIYNRLLESKKPQFIFTLTVANHTPYSIPSHYKPKPIIIPEVIKEKLRTSEKIALDNFTAYQYTADQLGTFINKIRKSPLGENTIIVATGDHNERGMFNFNNEDTFLKRSVPLIVYLPEKYKTRLKIDTDRFGSHKDIFPTIYNISLSDSRYFLSGNNLFSEQNTGFFSVNDYNLAASEAGLVLKQSKILKYVWQDKQYHRLIPLSNPHKLAGLIRKLDAHTALMMYILKNNLQHNIIKNKKH